MVELNVGLATPTNENIQSPCFLDPHRIEVTTTWVHGIHLEVNVDFAFHFHANLNH